ncbi:hypothetical protein [Celeribacter baekdonensis]|uniref:hypothetical protein n=1 Tax=Celeribacter baekdonensis TaxID=875171 RepID=UPI003A903A52
MTLNLKKSTITALITASAIMSLTGAASARDGKAWGGQCIVTSLDGAKVNSASCDSEGVKCSGTGWGGTSCSWSIAAPERVENADVIRAPKSTLGGTATKQMPSK